MYEFYDPKQILNADELLGWFPAVPILPHGEEVPLLALVGHPSSDVITIKIHYWVDVLLH